MPVWLRRFTVNELQKGINKSEGGETKIDENTLVDDKGRVNIPKFIQGKSSYK